MIILISVFNGKLNLIFVLEEIGSWMDRSALGLQYSYCSDPIFSLRLTRSAKTLAKKVIHVDLGCKWFNLNDAPVNETLDSWFSQPAIEHSSFDDYVVHVHVDWYLLLWWIGRQALGNNYDWLEKDWASAPKLKVKGHSYEVLLEKLAWTVIFMSLHLMQVNAEWTNHAECSFICTAVHISFLLFLYFWFPLDPPR